MANIHPIRAYRQKRQLTQGQLADQLNVDRVTVARWETGKRQVDKDKLLQISKITGIAPAQLRPDLAYLMAKVQRADVSDPPF